MVKKTNSKLKLKKVPISKKEKVTKIDVKDMPSLKMQKDSEVAMDFAIKVYERFNKVIKSIILFGSASKQTSVSGSDIDIGIILDDVSIEWNQELVAWYREELDKLLRKNIYSKSLHVNTIKLSTWWDDLMRGDPTIINMIRYGEKLVDFGGFFEPLKFLLIHGKIKSTPEAIYSCLQRAPQHFARSKLSELNCIEGLYWAMVDSAHAALISIKMLPPSPEHISKILKETFVRNRALSQKYVDWYQDLLDLHKKISHGEITDLKGVEIDAWQARTQEFMRAMATIVDNSLGLK